VEAILPEGPFKAPIVIAQSPLAKNPLPRGILGADQEFVAEETGDFFYELGDIAASDGWGPPPNSPLA